MPFHLIADEIRRVRFQRSFKRRRCSHLGHLPTTPALPPLACPECRLAGTRWVHLRMCLTCGSVGCCDTSPGGHAAAHFNASGHPVMQSIEPGEGWAWCYVDRAYLVPSYASAVSGG